MRKRLGHSSMPQLIPSLFISLQSRKMDRDQNKEKKEKCFGDGKELVRTSWGGVNEKEKKHEYFLVVRNKTQVIFNSTKEEIVN